MIDDDVPDGDGLFAAMAKMCAEKGVPPDALMSATANALCLMAFSWRPPDATVTDARAHVFRLVDESLRRMQHHPFACQGPRH